MDSAIKLIDVRMADPIDRRFKLSGTVKAECLHWASIAQSAIAYSALDEGERPFGDVGIGAMFQDASDFGRALDELPRIVGGGVRDAIGETIVEFAGLMALRDVEGAAHPEAVNGVLQILTEAGGGEGLAALRIDFTEARWSIGGGNHDPRGKERIIDSLITASFADGDLAELRSWYSSKGNPGADLLEQIDEAIISLTPGQVMLPNTSAGKNCLGSRKCFSTNAINANDNQVKPWRLRA